MDVYSLMKARVDHKLHLYRRNEVSKARLQDIKKIYMQKMLETNETYRRSQSDLCRINHMLLANSGHSMEAIPCFTSDEQLQNCEHYKTGIGINYKRLMKWRYEEAATKRHIAMNSCGNYDANKDRRETACDEVQSRQDRCKSAPALGRRKKAPDPFRSLKRQTSIWNPEHRTESIQAWADQQHRKYVEKVLTTSTLRRKRSPEMKNQPISGSDPKPRKQRSKSAPQQNIRALIKDHSGDAIMMVESANNKMQQVHSDETKVEQPQKAPLVSRNSTALLRTIMSMSSPKYERRHTSASLASRRTHSSKSETPKPVLLKTRELSFPKTKSKKKTAKKKDGSSSSDESVASSDDGPYIPRWRRELLVEAPPHIHELGRAKTPCTMPKWERQRLLDIMIDENREKLDQTRLSNSTYRTRHSVAHKSP